MFVLFLLNCLFCSIHTFILFYLSVCSVLLRCLFHSILFYLKIFNLCIPCTYLFCDAYLYVYRFLHEIKVFVFSCIDEYFAIIVMIF